MKLREARTKGCIIFKETTNRLAAYFQQKEGWLNNNGMKMPTHVNNC